MNPSKVEASTLATHFPFRTELNMKTGYYKRKNKFQSRPTKITVVLLDKYMPSVPKGKVRRSLASQGRIMSLQFHRGLSADAVNTKIKEA